MALKSITTGKWSTVMRTRKFVNLEFYSVLFKGSRERVICGLWPIYWSIRRVLFNVLRCLKRDLIIVTIHRRDAMMEVVDSDVTKIALMLFDISLFLIFYVLAQGHLVIKAIL